MSDEVTFDAPVKKKVAKKKVKVAKPSVPFPGLTRTACADKCNEKGCAISGRPYCAHPAKGRLQPDDMANPAAKKRLQEASDQISVRLDPDRFR